MIEIEDNNFLGSVHLYPFKNAFQAIEEHQNGAGPASRNGGGGVVSAGNGVGGGAQRAHYGVDRRGLR